MLRGHRAENEEVTEEDAAGRVIKFREDDGGAAEAGDGGDGESGDACSRMREIRLLRPSLPWTELTMIEMRGTAPVFSVPDVGATVRWYEQKLGFSYSTHPEVEPYEWASMVRDNVEIMLQRVVGYEKPNLYTRREGGVWDAYVRVTGIREFYDTVPADVNVISPLTHLEYGCDEFEVLDLNLYTLVFGECS